MQTKRAPSIQKNPIKNDDRLTNKQKTTTTNGKSNIIFDIITAINSTLHLMSVASFFIVVIVVVVMVVVVVVVVYIDVESVSI